ncbi:hypothetical protein ROHU_009819 [Labeo rohita]|uniref:Uncharacterized protein n=1 Tax=Labeo rohita TaxID=84645 RepID=A0A498M291_LABRO|nr:hypothetical protein ROHU_009819 [Labeo rohita]
MLMCPHLLLLDGFLDGPLSGNSHQQWYQDIYSEKHKQRLDPVSQSVPDSEVLSLGCHLAVVESLACPDEPESNAVWSLSSW